ncbi:OCIA domain-containing protein 2 [Apodemus speciosus]|uniref:OCIA domain-containing protein 1 n=1 Tax=Apodemus speciosus TaxID=105296 RepID=A0ABQ0ERR4_APOSI
MVSGTGRIQSTRRQQKKDRHHGFSVYSREPREKSPLATTEQAEIQNHQPRDVTINNGLDSSPMESMLFCPKSKLHIHRGEIAKIIRECQEESFWKRDPAFFSISMLVTQGLVHQGYLAANPRFGSLPKVALAGLLGFGLGKASYIRVCQSKFHSFEDQLRGAGFGPEHNRRTQGWQLMGEHCLLTCEDCKTRRGLSEKAASQPSAS